jgi:hypothetical protein
MFHYHRGSEECSSSTARARKKEIMSILECNISPVLLETVYLLESSEDVVGWGTGKPT